MQRSISRGASWQALLADPPHASHVVQPYDEGLRRGEAAPAPVKCMKKGPVPMCACPELHHVLTDCGLPGIRDIPFGVHMCSFYRTPAELSETLVPYFAAGLRNRERGIWITAEPLTAATAVADLQRAGLDAQDAIDRGALIVRSYADWYASGGTLKGRDVVGLWLAEEERALTDGYSGCASPAT